MHRFTSIKHTFSRSEALAQKTSSGRKSKAPHNGSENKTQISSYQKPHVFLSANKMAHLCGEIRANFRSQKQDALLNATTAWPKISKTLFGDHGGSLPARADMVWFGTERLRPIPPSQHGWRSNCLREMHAGGLFV